MKLLLLLLTLCIAITTRVNALVITEVFSNPIGDDGGREWIEIYNNAETEVQLSGLSISIKGGTPIIVTPVSGGVTLPPGAYAVIGSTVGGATKFLQDYPIYSGILLKATISLVNTGVTSLDIRLSGVVVDSIGSYTAAKEGLSYAKQSSGLFSATSPTPGKENTFIINNEEVSETSAAPTAGIQTTIPQMSPPAADIIIYLPNEKVVVAGAPTLFSVNALTQSGKAIDNLRFNWTFGDGGQGVGSSTIYSYFHPGRYIAYVDATNGLIAGKARMLVKVVAPELSLSPIKNSKYGPYIEVNNPNPYELDISTWKLSIDDAQYVFPLNTILLPGVTSISGTSLGFSSSTAKSLSKVRLLFPNNEEIVKAYAESEEVLFSKKDVSATTSVVILPKNSTIVKAQPQIKKVSTSLSKNATTSSKMASSTTQSINKKDRRIATFLQSFFR